MEEHRNPERDAPTDMPEVIDLTADENGGLVPRSVMEGVEVVQEPDVCKKENSSSYEGNCVDTRQHINSITPDPIVASVTESSIRATSQFPDLHTAIEAFQRHSKLLGCPHVRVRDVLGRSLIWHALGMHYACTKDALDIMLHLTCTGHAL